VAVTVSEEGVSSDKFDCLAVCEHGESVYVGCSRCGTLQSTLEDDHGFIEGDESADKPERFGRAPTAASVMDNNMGTSPGPERKKAVMSALNQGLTKEEKKARREGRQVVRQSGAPQGLQFMQAKSDLLSFWKMSGDPVDRVISEVVTKQVRLVEERLHVKIQQERLEAIARACKVGIKAAEKKRRMNQAEIKLCVAAGFDKEGFSCPI
jgi:hypothetical protein